MDINLARIFVKTVEAKGFSAAGRLLSMPKRTVSKKVSALEAALGIRLFDRTTRRLTLTEAGARVYAHCVAACEHIEQAVREVHSLKNEPIGTLTIAAPGAIGVPTLLPAIGAFMERYPDIQIKLLLVNELVDLDKNHVDIMIWAGNSMPSGYAMRLVTRVEMALYAGTAYIDAYSAPTVPDELVRHVIVAFTQSMNGNRFVWDLHGSGTRIQVTPTGQPRFRSNDAAIILAAVASGYGVGGLPIRYVEQIPEGRALIPILPEWRATPIELSALFRDVTSLKTKLFLDFLAQWFKHLS